MKDVINFYQFLGIMILSIFPVFISLYTVDFKWLVILPITLSIGFNQAIKTLNKTK
jgi:hypothetical protein